MATKQPYAILGSVLAFVAGAINAGGFLAVGYYTSHMTGIASSVADYIVLDQMQAAMMALGFLLAFILGAITTSLIVNYARGRGYKNAYAPALIVESLLLLSFNFSDIESYKALGTGSVYFILLLCFIMGLQNAIITKISNATIRTTHITGIVTDIGIEIGRYICGKCLSKGSSTLYSSAKLGLYLLLVLSFMAGGIGGAFLFKTIGVTATIPLAMLLLILAVDMVRKS